MDDRWGHSYDSGNLHIRGTPQIIHFDTIFPHKPSIIKWGVAPWKGSYGRSPDLVTQSAQELDQDKKGTIQLHELRTVLEDRFNITDEETRKIFAALDASNHEDSPGVKGGGEVTNQNQLRHMGRVSKSLGFVRWSKRLFAKYMRK